MRERFCARAWAGVFARVAYVQVPNTGVRSREKTEREGAGVR